MVDQQLSQEELKAALEHRDMLADVRAILQTSAGQRFFKYLFKHFGAVELPPMGMEGVDLHEYLGHLRTGQQIFKIAAEANDILAAQLLTQIEKERYAELLEQNSV
jgi:hypothetical protein